MQKQMSVNRRGTTTSNRSLPNEKTTDPVLSKILREYASCSLDGHPRLSPKTSSRAVLSSLPPARDCPRPITLYTRLRCSCICRARASCLPLHRGKSMGVLRVPMCFTTSPTPPDMLRASKELPLSATPTSPPARAACGQAPFHACPSTHDLALHPPALACTFGARACVTPPRGISSLSGCACTYRTPSGLPSSRMRSFRSIDIHHRSSRGPCDASAPPMRPPADSPALVGACEHSPHVAVSHAHLRVLSVFFW